MHGFELTYLVCGILIGAGAVGFAALFLTIKLLREKERANEAVVNFWIGEAALVWKTVRDRPAQATPVQVRHTGSGSESPRPNPNFKPPTHKPGPGDGPDWWKNIT